MFGRFCQLQVCSEFSNSVDIREAKGLGCKSPPQRPIAWDVDSDEEPLDGPEVSVAAWFLRDGQLLLSIIPDLSPSA